jgi:hypothetical protein
MASQSLGQAVPPLKNTVVLTLSGDVTMAYLNDELGRLHANNEEGPANLIIDLEEVRFILVECLTTLISEVSARLRAGFQTRIRLPLSRDVRGFLRDWEFSHAFLKSTRVTLRELSDQDNLSRIREKDMEFRRRAAEAGQPLDENRRYAFYDVYETREGTRKAAINGRRFLKFRYWVTAEHRLADDPLRYKRAVLDESNRWLEDSDLREILRKGLGQYYQYLPSDVVHEAMSNCFRHGQARIAVGVSYADWDAPRQKDRHLTLVFWDDGTPSYETLRSRLDSGAGIIGSAFESADIVYYNAKAPGAVSPTLYSSKDVPTESSEEWEIMLATLYPGVTSDPAGDGQFWHPGLVDRRSPDAALPGRGLANLINGAVNVFNGSVAFRSGSYFMNVKKGRRSHSNNLDSPVPYSVKMAHHWYFLGNMVTIRLPLNR